MPEQLSSLPELVRRYADRVLPREPGAGRTVRIAQVGEMVLKPGARPRAFSLIFKKARPLRRGDLEATVSMLPCSSPPRIAVNCPTGQMFPIRNSVFSVISVFRTQRPLW